MTDDAELLRRYAEGKSEEAFAELVRRQIDLVYAVALRKVGGDAHLAQDVVQRVFTDLAAKAGRLAGHPVLAGWLFTSTHYAATQLVRAERRRRAREEKAETMNELIRDNGPVTDWERLRPTLDDVVSELSERDREAVLLRFFEGRTLADVGTRLRLTEDGARSRVQRALEKLRAALARRGVTSTSAAVGLALANQVGAAPAGLAASVTGVALAGAGMTLAGAAGTGGGVLKFMAISKLQMGIIGVLVGAGAVGYVRIGEAHAAVQREIEGLQAQQGAVAALRAENRRLADTAAEVAVLRRDDAELAELARELTEVKRVREEAVRKVAVADREAWLEREVARMNGEGNRLVDDFKGLMERSQDAAQPAEIRAAAGAAAKEKLEAIKTKKAEITAFIAANRTPDSRLGGGLMPLPVPSRKTTEALSPEKFKILGGTMTLQSTEPPREGDATGASKSP